MFDYKSFIFLDCFFAFPVEAYFDRTKLWNCIEMVDWFIIIIIICTQYK